MEYTKEFIDSLLIQGVTNEEAETVITFGRTVDTATVFTNDNTVITKLKKLYENNPESWKLISHSHTKDGKITGVQFSCPKKCISLRGGVQTREITEKQRQQCAERMRNLRKKSK